MKRHQPAHWIAGESFEMAVIKPHETIVDLYWYASEWLTEGELHVMTHNQLHAGMVLEAEASGWMLNAIDVYDRWFDQASAMS